MTFRRRLPTALLGVALIAVVQAIPPSPRGVKWQKSADGRFVFCVDSIKREIAVAQVKSAHGMIRRGGQEIAMPSVTNILWRTSVENAWLQDCRVECVNTGECLVVIAPRAAVEKDSTYPRSAVEIFHRDGRHFELPWNVFIKAIVEVRPKSDAEERYHWLRSVDSVSDAELRLTNARGSTLAVDLASGDVKRLEYGPDEPRTPFEEPAGGAGK